MGLKKSFLGRGGARPSQEAAFTVSTFSTEKIPQFNENYLYFFFTFDLSRQKSDDISLQQSLDLSRGRRDIKREKLLVRGGG